MRMTLQCTVLSELTMVRLKIIRGNDPKLFSIGFKPLVTALPFKDEKKSVHFEEDEEFDEDDKYSEVDGEEESDYEGLRIATRAHVPYNLHEYNKNALLLIDATGTGEEPSIYNRHILAKMADVTSTFAKLQFEIEQYVHLTQDEIKEKCQEFLQRDFSNYGCVAVVAITVDGRGFDDSTIVRYWKNDGNPTLQSKPKIYIHEGQLTHRWGLDNYRRGSFYSSPVTEDHPDVLCLHLTSWPGDVKDRPMRTFCKKLDELADYDDLVTIIKESIREIKPMYRSMIYVASTLERRLFLSRNEHEVTRL